MKKKIIIFFTLICVLCSCKEDPAVDFFSIDGQWQLTGIRSKAILIGSETIEVYLEFTSDGQFNIYQILGKGRPRHYSGQYTLRENLLSGKYSDGKSWATVYEVTKTDGILLLSNTTGREVDTYSKAVIPKNIIDSAI